MTAERIHKSPYLAITILRLPCTHTKPVRMGVTGENYKTVIYSTDDRAEAFQRFITEQASNAIKDLQWIEGEIGPGRWTYIALRPGYSLHHDSEQDYAPEGYRMDTPLVCSDCGSRSISVECICAQHSDGERADISIEGVCDSGHACNECGSSNIEPESEIRARVDAALAEDEGKA